MGKLRHRRRDSIREERRNGVANGSVQSDVELSSRSKRPMPSVVVGLRPNALPERLQDVGEPVGGDERNATKPLDQAKDRRRERRDRTQEVAGSSPASP